MFKSLVILFATSGLFFITGFLKAPQPADHFSEPNSLRGEAPSLAVEANKVHLSFARGDSIYYSFSQDRGQSFSAPVLIAVLKGLGCSGGRGPQLICSNGRLLIAAPDSDGNFYAYTKDKNADAWKKAGRINDQPDIAKEGFISLGAGTNGRLFATWLDLRNGQKNNIYGARSLDGGKTWLKNQLVYKSPEGSVCECCKPSVAVNGSQVAVMFRNNLNGNRDLYLIQSANGGATFGTAKKLGEGSWKLTGCPMDGGGLTIGNNNAINTVWRREGNIYTSEPGKQEVMVSKGKQCAIAGASGAVYICFINEGKLYCRKPNGQLIPLGPGGSYPKMAAIDPSTIICAWELDNKVYTAIVPG